MADRGVELLLRQIREGGTAVHERVPYELVEGESARGLAPR